MERWVGKVAVVTGASSGIGAATTVALADKGLIVIGLARREEVVKKLQSKTKGKIHSKKCDVTDEAEVMAVFEWIEKILGGVDVLVNCAGVVEIAGLIEGKTSQWSNVMNTNVMALSVCTREATKSMRHRGDCGQIIHVNSIAGHSVPQFTHMPLGMYPASKFAVTALTESLRVELMGLNSGIKVSSVSPGTVQTDMIANVQREMTQMLAAAKKASQAPKAEQSKVQELKKSYQNEALAAAPMSLSAASDKSVPANAATRNEVLAPEDVVDAILYILATKPHVQVQDLIVQPVGQKYA